MPDDDALDERLRAVERALTDGHADLADVRDAAALSGEIDSLADRLDEVEDRLDELDAAAQALRGYVGNVRAVNDDVERRADAALAAVERLEADLDAANSTGDSGARDDAVARDDAAGRGDTVGRGDIAGNGESARDRPPASDRPRDRDCLRGRDCSNGRDRPCGCASRSSADATRHDRAGTTPDHARTSEREADAAESGDGESGVLGRLAATLAELRAGLTGSR